MALKDKINTAKEVLSDTKARTVVIILALLVVITFTIAFVKFKRSQLPPAGLGSAMTGVPNIVSIPGMGQPTREYAKLQEQQNIQLAQEAARKGTSAIPTVVRTTYLDTGVSTDLSAKSGATSSQGCGVEDLRKARLSGVSVSELRCRGCSLAALKAAGFTAGELRDGGFSAKDLKDAGFSAEDLKNAGFSAKDLAAAGFSAGELASAGFTAGELRDAGFSAADLKNAGFSAADLKAAGFDATALKDAGFTAKDLAAAGFEARDLKAAGFGDNDLKNAGFSDDAIRRAADELAKKSAFSCDVKNLQSARAKGVSASELKKLGCSAAALKAAGYTAAELKAAGFSAKELKDAGFTAADLRAAGFSAADLRNAGFSAKDLKDAGFSAKDLKGAGFSAGELRQAGFSAKDLKDAGFSAADLKNAGFGAKELSDAGFTPDELQAAGFTPGDLVRAGVAAGIDGSGIQVNTCSVENLKKARAVGTKAADLKKLGCSAAALKAAGFTAKELKAAGFSAAELKAAGFSAKDLKDAGFSAKELKDAGFSAADLKAAGFSAKELNDAGFSKNDLVAAGFSPDELSAANITDGSAQDLATIAAAIQAGSTGFSSLQDNLGKMSADRMSAMSDQDIENFIRQQQAMMMVQANQLFSAWSPIPSQQYVAGESPKPEAEPKPLTEEEKKEIALKNSDIFKAGTVIFAVLDTEVNSDESSPVMATVIQGPLKGSKVIGNFQRVDKRLLIQFSVLSVPKLNNSIAVQAVAVDPNTDKTALATSVDNHYLMRYGTLLASSFLSGLGDAVQSSGTSIVTTNNTTIGTSTALNTAQKGLVALGNMARQFGTAMAPLTNKPPTVKVSSGTSVGLLLMADLAVPKGPLLEQKN